MSKYKLVLLGGIISLFGIINYSSANSITFTKIGDWDYSPHTFEAFDGMTNSIDYLCSPDLPCGIRFDDGNFNECFSMMCYNGDCTTFTQYSCVNGQTYNIEVSGASEVPFSSITFSDGQITGGGIGTGLIGQLSPIIIGLDNVIVEFIPYVVYVGLGVLGVLIGFFAIKRLINWVRGSSLSVFNSGRKRK